MNELAIPTSAVAAETSRIVLEQADRLFRGIVTAEAMAEADHGAWPAQIWNAVEQAGLPLALVSEAHGGVGLPAADALRVIRRSAYYTLPVPLAETMLARMLWTQAGGEALPGSLSLAPVRSDDAIRIQRSSRGCELSGSARRVPWGGQADHVLLFARDAADAGWLALLPRGTVALGSFRNIANEPRDTLVLDAVALNVSAVLPAPKLERDAEMTLGAAVRAQQMVGAMERCIDYA
ncbi:MAG: acyl-CoA dehydrogenase, partial [Betaproteobacteria bacterium]